MDPGRLLVATPLLRDAHFVRSVVYLIGADDGSAGVVIDRPTDIAVAAILPAWADTAAPPGKVHFGGPVAVEHALALGRGSQGEMVTSDLAVVDLAGPADAIVPGSIRVFAGYTGWTPGQLEAEIAADAWFVVDGTADDVFDPEPMTLWHRVLARQPGKLSRFANYPADPRLN